MAYAIGIDFDGVIHKYSGGWQDGSIYDVPIPGARDALLDLLNEYAIFIHTTRESLQVVEWMNNHLFPRDLFPLVPIVITEKHLPEDLEFWNSQTEILVTNKKYPALAYIDDRAIRFLNWTQAMKELEYHVSK